jgi:diaminopimelate decarboxylase
MNSFHYDARRHALLAEQLPLKQIAEQFGTPCFVYSRAALTQAWQAFAQACTGRNALVCYAVKANSNLAILNLFARLGAGFDIVSGGELARVLAAGGDARKVVFSGVGKSRDEMRQALQAGVFCFNVESESELERLSQVAVQMGLRAAVSLRVNPEVDPKTHPYIATGLRDSKFGVEFAEAERLYRRAATLPGIEICGVDCHIGSQITESAPFLEAADKVLGLIDRLAAAGIAIRHLDLGGGLGIRYRDEAPPAVAEHLDKVFALLGARPLQLVLEPGRALVGNAGVLLTQVEYLKHGSAHNFAIIDAAMNDLMRPALYEAWHDILPVQPRPDGEARDYDVVGPVCETGDFLGLNRRLALHEGDLLAVMSAGAYGMSMSSNYNTRARAAEVMVDGDKVHLIGERESLSSLYAREHCLPAE